MAKIKKFNITGRCNPERHYMVDSQTRDQLASYLTTRGTAEGYLVTFDFSKQRKETEPHWIEHMGKRIFETTI